MDYRVISITGNTATGTTTLARRLNEIVGWQAIYSEDYLAQSPFFTKFLENPFLWAFQNQAFFIAEYVECYQATIQELSHSPKVVCLDYTIYELSIYTEAMKARGFLPLDEYTVLKRILSLIAPILYTPNLLIYLTADIDLLAVRLKERGRPGEDEIDMNYLETLQSSFDRFIASWTKSPILSVDSGRTDFPHDDEVIRQIAAQALSKMS